MAPDQRQSESERILEEARPAFKVVTPDGCMLGYGPTAQHAMRVFVRNVWRTALRAVAVSRIDGDYRPDPRTEELWTWCMRYCAESQPLNWDWALKARGIR